MSLNIENDTTAPPRILISKIGLDGHDRGAMVVSSYLRDQGYEVVYLGLHKTPSEIAAIALQEDVDAIGISILSGSHLPLIQKLKTELSLRHLDSVLIFIGGTIPKEDDASLRELGVKGIFPTGSTLTAIDEWLKQHLKHQ
jgi:methylmalonyl-CoA mutase C-terminal domain/subunit